jgi:hypothetical protein
MIKMSEFTYFEDGQVDRVLGLVWQLAQEIHVTRQRLLSLEAVLVSKNLLSAGELSAFSPDESSQQHLTADGKQFMERLIRTIAEKDDHRSPMRDQFSAKLAESKGGAS